MNAASMALGAALASSRHAVVVKRAPNSEFAIRVIAVASVGAPSVTEAPEAVRIDVVEDGAGIPGSPAPEILDMSMQVDSRAAEGTSG